MEKLGINLPVFLAQLVNFTVLLILLYFTAYRPVMRMLNERSAKIKESMSQAEEIKQKMSRVEEEVKSVMEKARQEGQSLINQASQNGERMKEEAKKDAQANAEVLIEKAKAEISRERDQAIVELKKEFTGIAINVAEKIIKESLDKEKHQRIIRDALKQNVTFGEKN